MRRLALLSLLLTVVTLAAYWPVRQAGFTNYDDDVYVTDNPHVLNGLTAEGFQWAFTTFHACNWHPLTWLSHMADCSLFGESAPASHLVNVAFHVANALLLLALLWWMTGALWRSGFVAALFALHPLHVESAAWIAERKDVLSTFFGLLALWAYARYAMGGGRRATIARRSKAQSLKSNVHGMRADAPHGAHSALRTPHSAFYYGLALVLFALALLSKPMLVTLPCLMLLLDYWPLQRFQAKAPHPGLQPLGCLLREKLPFFALAAASSVATFWAQNSGGAVVTLKNIPVGDRLANAAVAYVSYLAKALWPNHLAVPYPFVLGLPALEVALAAASLLGITALSVLAARRAPYLLTGWLWYLASLVPVIGLVQVGIQAMADRYTYLPLVGVFILVSWGAVEVTAGWRYQRLALPLLSAAILSGCFICTRRQVSYWRNDLALFAHTLSVTHDNAVAEQCFGFALALSGNEREAVHHFDLALGLWPDYLPARLDRGIALMLAGRADEAVCEFRQAIRLRPDSAKAYYQLAGALAHQKKLEEAKANYLLALRCQSDFAEAHSKLGMLLLLQGDNTQAMAELAAAVRIRPDCAEAQYALGNQLAQRQDFAHAIIHLRAAISAQPNYASALNDLAWILATQEDPALRNLPQAIRLARRGCQLTWNKEPRLLDTLGVALSEAGEFSEAIRVTEQAAAAAAAVKDAPAVARLQQRLESYRNGKGYRSIPQ